MKVLALTLPQYHRIPENDKWWGEGFTDWDNVKRAKPLYDGHNQPVVPHKKYYYDMSDISTIEWQAKVAKKYGVYGFCYYHYWFNGKLLLEKPCENLVKHPEIDCNYCFCWANESWARTWDGKDKEILIKQTFGGKTDWEKHIQYLIPFFQDERYIKKDRHPVLFFYSVERIEQFNEMIDYWNAQLLKNGLDTIFAIEFVNTFSSGNNELKTDAVCEFEPHATAKYNISLFCKAKRLICKKIGMTDYLNYDDIWRRLLRKNNKYGKKKIVKSCFTGFDNSPRKKKKALIIKGSTPKKFYRYLRELINKTDRNYLDDYLVVNAWNEWAEGAVLEPTEKDGYRYLKAIKRAQEID